MTLDPFQKDLITFKEAASLAKRCVKTIRRWQNDGLVSIQIPKRSSGIWYTTKAELRKYVEGVQDE